MIKKIAIDIVVVNWNSGSQLRTCVESVCAFGAELVNNVVVVDNASSDDSLRRAEALTDLPFSLHIIRNNVNHGFAKACNQGSAVATSEYLLFLNPDTRLFSNSLSVPHAFMQCPGNADVAIVGIQLVDGEDCIAKTCARFPSLGIFVAEALGISRLPGLQHFATHMNEWAHDRTATVDHVMGAFYFMRRRVFESLGGFDEMFFVYLEDLDLSMRAHKAGWRSVYLANTRAFHAGGGTSRQVKAHRLFYSLRSRLLYGFKHFTRRQAWLLLSVTISIEPISRMVFSLVRGGTQDVRNTLRGYAMLYCDLPNILGNPQTPSIS